MKNAILDTLVITKRQLLQLARVPELLVFSTIQPVMFVLLFRYVFGGSIDTGQPGGYVQLLMPGIFVQTVAEPIHIKIDHDNIDENKREFTINAPELIIKGLS